MEIQPQTAGARLPEDFGTEAGQMQHKEVAVWYAEVAIAK